MSTSSAELAPGQMGFDLIAVLAVSAMAQVELCRIAEGEPRGAVVAVKRLPHDVVEDDELRQMFRDEIWMAAALDHPNIARVLAWGEDERGPFLVSEFVHGVPLSRLMRTVFNTGEHFTERLVVCLASAVSGGLAAAHELRGPDGEHLGLVHRELTPGNILLGFDGSVKITDFGLAKAKHRITFTAVGQTKGDPAFMSPEQVLGQPLDGRSDIFALGVLLFELFAQEPPWRVRSVRDALQAIVHGPSPDLGRHCSRLDPAIVAMVNRCLAKAPDDRYPTVHLLKGELDRWLELHGYRDSRDHLARFVRRNALRQMRWLERLLRGEGADSYDPRDDSPYDGSDAETSSSSHVALPPGAQPAFGAGSARAAGSCSGSAELPPAQGSGSGPRTPGRVVGPEDAPPLPARAHAPEVFRVDDPETIPSSARVLIEDPESAPTTIDRGRARMGTVTLAAHRPREGDPRWGTTTASTATTTREPPTQPRSAEQEMRAAAGRIVDSVDDLTGRAHAAAESARAAAKEAEAAASRAVRGAQAVRLAVEAMRLLDEGQTARANELLARAGTLVDGS